MVGLHHAVALDGEHRGVDVASRAVIVGGVDMYHQRFAGHLLGVDSRRICQPVMGVDDIAGDGAGYHPGHDGVVVDFLQQVVGIAA